MYCVKCGVKLADTEQKCPLCYTRVCHPDLPQPSAQPLYPRGKMPGQSAGRQAVGGLILFLFLLPLLLCLCGDLQPDGQLDWFGYVAGALLVCYVAIALPQWFRRPNPVIFVPCVFAAAAAYLLYVDLVTEGGWFLSFGLPVVGSLGLIVSAVVTLLRYARRGKWFILGGAFVALGALTLAVELLLDLTFRVAFVGWSVYPLVVLMLLGGNLIYLGINRAAREMLARKLFF